MDYTVIFYETEKSKIPVEEYILSLSLKSQAKIYKSLELLETYGVNIPYPYVSHIEDKLFELRIKFSSNQYRILYFIDTGKEIILLHAFSKKTKAIRKTDIDLAKSRKKDYLERRKK